MQNSFRLPLSILSLTLLHLLLAASAFGQLVNPVPEPQPQRDVPWSAKAAMDPQQSDRSYREDFTALGLSGSNLKIDIAVLGEKDDDANRPFIRERWHLVWRPGDPIDVYIVRPRNVAKPPVVLYLYSYPQDTDRFKLDSWCSYAVGDGFAAVGFVSAYTGHRLEFQPPKDDFFNQLPQSLGATVHDVQMILNFLATRTDLDLNRVGMFGQGSGGAIAILSSAVDSRIKSIDTLTPWGDWPQFVADSTFIPSEDRLKMNTAQFLEGLTGLDPVTWLPKVKAQNVRIQNVRGDRHMPDKAQERLEAVAPPSATINQFGDAAALVPEAANGKLLEWIKNSLQNPAASPVQAQNAQRVHFFPAKAIKNPLGDTPERASAAAAPQAKQ